MDVGTAGLALLVIVVLAIAAGAVWWRGRGASPTPAPAPVRQVSTRQEPASLEERLRALQTAGRWDELLRLLDRSLPEWPVSSSLIEVARSVQTLERDVAAIRGTAVSEVVTSRLTQQAQDVSDGLWSLADRLVVANRLSRSPAREQLEREDAVLLRLLPAIQEAQSGLVELTLAASNRDDLRRAEGRFLALAATARELQELGPPPR
jgi:hypothetical protein